MFNLISTTCFLQRLRSWALNSQCFCASKENSNHRFHIIDKHLLEIQFVILNLPRLLIPHLKNDYLIDIPILTAISKRVKRLWFLILILRNPILILCLLLRQKPWFNRLVNILKVLSKSHISISFLVLGTQWFSFLIIDNLHFLLTCNLGISVHYILFFLFFSLTSSSVSLVWTYLIFLDTSRILQGKSTHLLMVNSLAVVSNINCCGVRPFLFLSVIFVCFWSWLSHFSGVCFIFTAFETIDRVDVASLLHFYLIIYLTKL